MPEILSAPSTIEITRFQCRHIFTNGRRCGSPALREENFCYYHHTTRKPVTAPRSRAKNFDLPLPEDRSAIQQSIGEVLQRIAAGLIDPRRAGLLLYGLQIASLNLQKDPQNATTEPVTELTLHPTLGPLAPPAELDPPADAAPTLADLILRNFHHHQTHPGEEPSEDESPTGPIHLQAVAELQTPHHPRSRPNPNPLKTLHKNKGEGGTADYPGAPRLDSETWDPNSPNRRGVLSTKTPLHEDSGKPHRQENGSTVSCPWAKYSGKNSPGSPSSRFARSSHAQSA